MHPLLRKLLSPVGFLFVALCFLLPFVAASCQSAGTELASLSYTGGDLIAGGRPELDLSDQLRQRLSGLPPGYADEVTGKETGSVPVQVLLLAALGVAVAGVAVGALRRPWPRALAATGTGLITAILLAGGEVIAVHAVHRRVEPAAADVLGSGGYSSPAGLDVHPRYGFWLALLLSIALAGFNGVTLLRLSRTTGQPERESALSPSG